MRFPLFLPVWCEITGFRDGRGAREIDSMCKSTTGFHGTIKGFHKGPRDFAVIDMVETYSDHVNGLEYLIPTQDWYETIQLSEDAMDEGRCEFLGDMDTLHTSDDAPFTASWGEFSSYTLPAAECSDSEDDQYENGEEVSDIVLTDRETDGVFPGFPVTGGRWEMKVKGGQPGW